MTDRDERDDRPRDRLEEAREALPREIAPPRDVWPSIHRAISRERGLGELDRPAAAAPRARARRRSGLTRFIEAPSWGLLGAACALACVIGVTATWLALGGRPSGGPGETERGAPSAIATTLEGLEHECARVRADLLTLLGSEVAVPSEKTKEVLLANLAIIESAVAESRAALRANPHDALLAELTVSAYREQLAFLKGATRVPFRPASSEQI